MSTTCEGIRRGFCCLCGIIAIFWGANLPAAQVAITAVKHNGAAITPTSSITALPGDVIEAELLVSGWANELPEGVRAYNLVLQGRKGVQSGSNGLVLPKGWKAAVIPKTCASPADCAPGEICQGLCVQPGHNPAFGAFIDETRPDYILHGLSSVGGVNVSSLDFVYFIQTFDSVGVTDPGKALYAGTLIVEIDEFACGTFRFQLAACEASFLVSLFSHQVSYPSFVPLDIKLAECPAIPLTSDPANCAIDARIPHPPGVPQTTLSWQAIDMSFSGSPTGLTPASFRSREVPASGAAPSITSLTPLAADAVRANLSTSAELVIWTCLEHRASSREICFAPLPGDVNQNGISDTNDVAALINDLRAIPTAPRLPLVQCDIDRSGRCAPRDITMLVDLLAGHGFDAWAGAEFHEPCPSTGDLDSRTPRGACCDRVARCQDDRPVEQCPAVDDRTWIQDAQCCEIPCFVPTGACCNMGTGDCQDGTAESSCAAVEESWHEDTTCDEIFCLTTLGACCNVDTGGCSDNRTREQCSGGSLVWLLGYECNEVGCVPR